MLSMNNMLTTGGNRQRTRRSVRVSEPAYGFFITGSSIEKMNGVYVRQNAPKSMRSALPPGRLIALYYKHEEGGWTMNLDQLPEQEEEESDEDDYLYSRFSRFHEKKPTHEWVIRDEFMAARFTHDGDTIVPGAGVRWNFAVKEVPSTTGETAAAGATASTADAAEPSQTALTEIKENDEDELPWQVIAILDIETVQDLLYSSQYHKQKIREAKAGKNAPAPSVATLVGAAAPGRWLFRVVAPEGVTLHLEPDEASEEVGVRQCGEYLRAVELGGGGEWLRLGSCEDTDPNRSRSGFGKMGSARRAGAAGYYNADLSRREVWLRLCVTVGSSTKTYVEEVPASETAVLNLRGVGDSKDSNAAHASDMNVDAGGGGGGSKGSSSSEAQAAIKDKSDGDDEVDGGSGLTGDYFDKPFVPRMDDGVSGSNESELVARAAAREAENEEVLATSQSRSSFLSTAQWGVPIGAAVTVSGLKSRVGAQYNGLTGVVVTPLDAASGRQGVRLNAPFSGKILSCKPSTLSFSSEGRGGDTVTATGEENDENFRRAARLLGLSAVQLNMPHLSDAAARTAASGDDAGEQPLPTSCLDMPEGWGFGGLRPEACVGTALRSVMRDHGLVSGYSLCDDARLAADLLLKGIGVSEKAADSSASPLLLEEKAPFVMVRSGALGGRAAAAVVSAFSTLSNAERTAGLEELQDTLRDEIQRSRSARDSVLENDGEDSEGRDELLLRIALVQALLEGRREAEALEQIRYAAKFYAEMQMSKLIGDCPAVSLLLGVCLLRLGMRADGLSTLESVKQQQQKLQEEGAEGELLARSTADWLWPLWLWGAKEAQLLLRVHHAAEQCREAAVETYARGSFQDAANLYSRVILLLQQGLPEDKRGRATALADRAGCLRRARKLDEAVQDLDSALRLFPRYTRALFRRATCLLEAGKADDAVEAFKALYRVDRDWPNLSEWLVRAFSLKKRQAKGYRRDSDDDDDDDDSDEDYNYDDPSPRRGRKKAAASDGGAQANAEGMTEADIIAREVDHYTVLGVTTDATEKQLKTAYRLRSLKFHPDRKEGHTAAFQRIAEAYEVLSDESKRRNYDEGVDIKVKRGRRDEEDDSDDSAEEHKTNMREEVEREFYPERYSFWPFGDPFIYKRKREAQKRAREGRPAWDDED